MRVAYAPYRISLFGGGTDYPEWYMRKGGVAVNFTIDKGIQVLISEEGDELTRKAINDTGKDAYNVVTKGDYPQETGLGGSASYAVALSMALQGTDQVDRMTLATYAYGLERGVGRMVGIQDHLAASYGGQRVFWFRTGGKIEADHLQIQEGELRDLCSHMMLLPIKREEKGSAVAERYKGVNMEKTFQRALQGLTALEKKDWEKVGYEMAEAWREKREWANGVTTVKIDGLVNNALRMGAWGAKLLGAGGGGMVLVLAENIEETYERVRRRGYAGPMHRIAPDMQGARMVRTWKDGAT